MKTKHFLVAVATICLFIILIAGIQIFFSVSGDLTSRLIASALFVIVFGLPSWILYLIALKLHMGDKSIFSLSI